MQLLSCPINLPWHFSINAWKHPKSLTSPEVSLKFLNPSLDALYGLLIQTGSFQTDWSWCQVLGSFFVLFPSLVSSLIFSCQAPGQGLSLNLNSRTKITLCQFLSLMRSLWAPSLKLTLKGSSSLLSSPCLSSLPDVSSGRDSEARDQDNNEQRPGAETWAGNMRGLYIGEGILRSLVKLLIVPEQKNSKQFIQHMPGLYNLFLQILLCRDYLESFVQCGKKLNDL